MVTKAIIPKCSDVRDTRRRCQKLAPRRQMATTRSKRTKQEDDVRMSRKISLCATAAALVLETLAASAEEPVLRIAKPGSMEPGGQTITCTTNDGGDANSTRWPSGHVVIDQVYASFQYPA